MKSPKFYVPLILILFLVFLFIVSYNKTKPETDPIDEIINEIPSAPEGLSRNERIKLAFTQFKEYAGNDSKKFERLCKGGFINEDINQLKKIVDEIVLNRVINFKPLEYALNQDESGISCLSSPLKWVLFTALNDDGEEEKPYYCTDSRGRMGNFGIDRENIQCL